VSGNDQGSSEFHSVPLSNEDRDAYGEGLRRGGFMLCAEVDDDEDADKIVSILEQTSGVDLDERQAGWRSEGWSGSSQSSTDQSSFDQTSTGQSSQQFMSGSGQTERSGIIEEERIPIVQEQLRVGKREVERGGARVRSYVEERPVTESVNLREEHVDVTRRPVDQPISAADLNSSGLLQDREIEMRETAEEAVVAKEARVTEEVLIQKTAQDRTEQVQDTVRNTEVEVDEDGRGSGRGAFGFDGDRETSTSREFDNDPTNRR
jgi:uncharacterized protein (TIGR02271 family)